MDDRLRALGHLLSAPGTNSSNRISNAGPWFAISLLSLLLVNSEFCWSTAPQLTRFLWNHDPADNNANLIPNIPGGRRKKNRLRVRVRPLVLMARSESFLEYFMLILVEVPNQVSRILTLWVLPLNFDSQGAAQKLFGQPLAAGPRRGSQSRVQSYQKLRR